MTKREFHYRMVVQPDERTGSNEPCYTAYVPTLGVASCGDTIEEATVNGKEAATLFVENLLELGLEVPELNPQASWPDYQGS